MRNMFMYQTNLMLQVNAKDMSDFYLDFYKPLAISSL